MNSLKQVHESVVVILNTRFTQSMYATCLSSDFIALGFHFCNLISGFLNFK